MRNRYLHAIAALAATVVLSRAAFSQTGSPPGSKAGAKTGTQTTPAPDAKNANQAIYSGTHHEGSVPPHDISGVWMISEDFRFSPTHEPRAASFSRGPWRS